MLYLYLNQYNMLFLSVNKQEYLHNKYINQLAQLPNLVIFQFSFPHYSHFPFFITLS